MRVLTEPTSFQIKKNGAVIGNIWLNFNGRNFPEEKWSDFVSVLLLWWFKEWIRLSENNAEKVVLMFMEGPFQVNLTRIEEEKIKIEFVRRGNSNSVYEQGVLNEPEFGIEILNAVKLFLEQSKENKWESKEIQELRSAYLSHSK
jgi:hypothetical protein